MLLALTTHPQTFLDGHEVAADVVRLFIIITGFTLCMVALKISVRAFRFLDWERAFGTLAFALIVVTPAISGLYRFGDPLLLWTSVTYLIGLSAGVIATYFRVTLRWAWWQRAGDRRRQARAARRGLSVRR